MYNNDKGPVGNQRFQRGRGQVSNASGAGTSGPLNRGKSNSKNNHISSNRLRLTQQYVEAVGLGASNNRLRLTKQYIEAVGLGSSNNRLRLTEQYIEVIVKDTRGRSFAVII